MYGAASEGGFFGRHPFGNAVLSRLPLQDVRHEPLRLRDGDLTLGGQVRLRGGIRGRGRVRGLARGAPPTTWSLP